MYRAWAHVNLRKVTEVIGLLYEATQAPLQPTEKPNLNPTVGVYGKEYQASQNVEFRKDPTRPGGGVFYATQTVVEGYNDISTSCFVIVDEKEDRKRREEREKEERERLKEKMDVDGGNTSTENGQQVSVPTAPPPPPPSALNSHSDSSFSSSSSLTGPSLSNPTDTPPHLSTASATPILGHPVSSVHVPPPPPPIPLPLPPSHFRPTASSNLNPTISGNKEYSDVQILNMLDVPPPPAGDVEPFTFLDSGLLTGLPGTMFDWEQWDSFFARFAMPGDLGYAAAGNPVDTEMAAAGAPTGPSHIPTMPVHHPLHPMAASHPSLAQLQAQQHAQHASMHHHVPMGPPRPPMQPQPQFGPAIYHSLGGHAAHH